MSGQSDIFVLQGQLHDAADNSIEEGVAFKARAKLLKSMTPEAKRRATIIAAGVLHLCL